MATSAADSVATGAGGGKDCRNCGALLTGAYCGTCGQRRLPEAESTLELLREWAGDALGADSRLMRTLRVLARPGALALEHRTGRRVPYLSPIQLYSLLSGLFFGLYLMTRGPDQRYYGLRPEDQSGYVASMARAILLLVPGMALALKAVEWRRKLAEHMVFALYVAAAAFAGASLMQLLSTGWKLWFGSIFQSPTSPIQAVWAPGWLAMIGYLGVAMRRVYGRHPVVATLQTVAVVVATVAAFVGVTLVLARLKLL